jgi:hypothetical protein
MLESEGIMANEVTAVVLTTEIKGPPGTNIIKLEEVLIHGAGALTEALEGGQASYTLTLRYGKVVSPGLKVGELVFVQGDLNGGAFKLPVALKTIKAHEPWTFEGKSGSTGP